MSIFDKIEIFRILFDCIEVIGMEDPHSAKIIKDLLENDQEYYWSCEEALLSLHIELTKAKLNARRVQHLRATNTSKALQKDLAYSTFSNIVEWKN